jgi:KDPG and KHG aldolase
VIAGTDGAAGLVQDREVEREVAADRDMWSVIERIRATGVVPVVEIDDAGRAVELAEALDAGGLSIVEVTFRTISSGFQRTAG